MTWGNPDIMFSEIKQNLSEDNKCQILSNYYLQAFYIHYLI